MTFATNSITNFDDYRVVPESVEDIVYLIAPMATPFSSNAGRTKTNSQYF